MRVSRVTNASRNVIARRPDFKKAIKLDIAYLQQNRESVTLSERD